MAKTMRAIGKRHKLAYTHDSADDGAIDIKNGKGGPDDLFINEVPLPEAKDGDAIVKIKAFGLNRMDLAEREGRYPVPPGTSKILGVEFSGVVESVNTADPCSFKAGDEVFGLAYGGKSPLRCTDSPVAYDLPQALTPNTSLCQLRCCSTNHKNSLGK